MKDEFSPSNNPVDDSTLSFDPMAMPGASVPDAPFDDVPILHFDTPEEDSGAGAFDPGFYGSYGEAVKSADPDPAYAPMPTGEDFSAPAVPSFDDAPAAPAVPFSLPEEDLTVPDMPIPAADPTRTSRKSMGYETTVKIKNARHAERDEKRINEPIKKDARPVYTPKGREFAGIASGTAHVSGGLPELRDDQMYVAVTPKELRLLKSRKFRGLGVFAALCLGIIAAFCIWTYANSFADPIVGRWKGNISSLALGIDALSELDQDGMDSTWEFSGSGTLYVNLVLKDTPVSLSGSYVQKTDKDGQPYVTMTLKSPLDNQDYTVEMYYTVTGSILQFNDMDGIGAEIDLTKE